MWGQVNAVHQRLSQGGMCRKAAASRSCVGRLKRHQADQSRHPSRFHFTSLSSSFACYAVSRPPILLRHQILANRSTCPCSSLLSRLGRSLCLRVRLRQLLVLLFWTRQRKAMCTFTYRCCRLAATSPPLEKASVSCAYFAISFSAACQEV